MNFLNTFFGNTQDEVRQDMRGFGNQAVSNSIRVANSAANRGNANPAALALAAANAGAGQRAALAGQQTQMMQQARLADQSRQNQIFGMGAQALGGGLAMLSDERSKENIQPGDRAIDQFMQAGDPSMFQYREGMPEGGQQRAGVMAQDIGQTQVGQTMIRQDPQTGMQGLDQNATISALLASVARLSDRLAAIEGPRG